MSFYQTGSCQRCSAAIYAPSDWCATIPPPHHYSCNCPRSVTVPAQPVPERWPPAPDSMVGGSSVVYVDNVPGVPWTDNFLGETQHPEPLHPHETNEDALDELGLALEEDDSVELVEDKQQALEDKLDGIVDCLQTLTDAVVDLVDKAASGKPVRVKKMATRKKKDLRKKILGD